MPTGNMADSTVSVVIPAFRVTAYIAQALDSVIAQTHPADEIVVINDGCPDTAALEAVLAPYRDRMVYRVQPNRGPAAARNAGIQAARGELIAFLDADDYWAPEFLARQTQYLRQHPDVDLVYTDAIFFSEAGRQLGTLMQMAPSTGEPNLQSLLDGTCTVATTTVMARRARLLAAGLFDEEIGNYSEDFDLWLRVAHSGGRIAYQREPLVHHRVHSNSLTAQRLQLPRGALRVLDKARASLQLAPAERAALERRHALIRADILAEEAKHLLLAGDYAGARGRMKEAVVARPTFKRRIAALGLRLAPALARQVLERRGGRAPNSAGRAL